jgi:hypothetical protein
MFKISKPAKQIMIHHLTVKFYLHLSMSKINYRFYFNYIFSSFNVQMNNQLQLTDFLNSVGQLKYRGTSVLFRLGTNVQDLLRMCK